MKLSNDRQHSQSNQSLLLLESKQYCHFCEGIDIHQCMMTSVVNKHNEQPNFYSKIIDNLLEKKQSTSSLKYQEILKTIDTEEKLTKFYTRSTGKTQIKQLLEYYKYRKFVPLFADIGLGKILHSYYYERLKLYYNLIKKKLNLTIEQSSDSDISNTDSMTISRTIQHQHRSRILDDLTTQIMRTDQNPTQNNIQAYKTQSKALQDLMKTLKANEKFKYVKSLNVQSQWDKVKKTSKQIFRDTIIQQRKIANNKDQLQKGNFKKNSKSKIFITFYSRDGAMLINNREFSSRKSLQGAGLKNLVIKSQKLGKSKDLKLINKEKQSKTIQKFEKIKNQIFDKKRNQISSLKQIQNNRLKIKSKASESGKKTPVPKLNVANTNHAYSATIKPIPQSSQLQLKSARQLIIQPCQKYKNSPYQEKVGPKTKRSQSEGKLKKGQNFVTQKQRIKSTKGISTKDLQNFVCNKKLVLQKSDLKGLTTERQKLVNKEELRKLRSQTPTPSTNSRRKSLDLIKMKPDELKLIEQIIYKQHTKKFQKQDSPETQIIRKQDYLTQRYQKLLMTPNKTTRDQIRSSRVTPEKRDSQFGAETNQLVLQKSDNIVSIKKKKLQILKKKIQIQKMQIQQQKTQKIQKY